MLESDQNIPNQKTTSSLLISFVLLSTAALLSSTNYRKILLLADADSIATVSIVRGASNPTTPSRYNPSPLKVNVGTTLTWTNNDCMLYTVSSCVPEQGVEVHLANMATRKTFLYTFDKASWQL